MDIDKVELKNEAKDTVNQVKDTIKNVDINKEAKETKGFLKGMLVDPFGTVERVARGEQELFKRAVVLVMLHMVFAFIVSIFGYKYGGVLNQLKQIIFDTISPAIAIIVPTILIILMNKNNKKSATTIISTLVVASVPKILVSGIDILEKILGSIYLITSPISTALSAIAILLAFVGMKTLFGEEKENFLPKFALIKFVTALVLYIF